jgi:LuxR family quorum sensing-dependent transcriptional regulator
VQTDQVQDHRLLAALTKRDLVETMSVIQSCLSSSDEDILHRAIRRFGDYLGYEFIFYGYTQAGYSCDQEVFLVNLSNPQEWMNEYAQKDLISRDPVRIEFELRLKRREQHGVIVWDRYARDLSGDEKQVIELRKAHGLRWGFSVFCDSPRKDSAFLISFARRSGASDRRAQRLALLVVPHLNICRKRLNLLELIGRLSRQEAAVAHWLVEGKTNWEISEILGVAPSTAKFHVANLLKKLRVTSRQKAVAMLTAERFLPGFW